MGIEPLPTADGESDPATVRQSLERLLKVMGGAGVVATAGIFDEWLAIAGEQLAAHATPVSLRGGTLVVSVDDPAWATELRWMSTELVDRVEQTLGARVVERVEVRVRPRGAEGD